MNNPILTFKMIEDLLDKYGSSEESIAGTFEGLNKFFRDLYEKGYIVEISNDPDATPVEIVRKEGDEQT